MSHLPAIPTIPGELTELAREFNEGEALAAQALAVLTDDSIFLAKEDRLKLVLFRIQWKTRAINVRLIVHARLNGMES